MNIPLPPLPAPQAYFGGAVWYQDDIREIQRESMRAALEAAAVASWMHFCDTCIANKLSPADFEKWCAASRIRALGHAAATP